MECNLAFTQSTRHIEFFNVKTFCSHLILIVDNLEWALLFWEVHENDRLVLVLFQSLASKVWLSKLKKPIYHFVLL